MSSSISLKRSASCGCLPDGLPRAPAPQADSAHGAQDDMLVLPHRSVRRFAAHVLPPAPQTPRSPTLNPCRVTPPDRDLVTPRAADAEVAAHFRDLFPAAKRVGVQRMSEGYSNMQPYRVAVDDVVYFAKYCPIEHEDKLLLEAQCAELASNAGITPALVDVRRRDDAWIMISHYFPSTFIPGEVLQRDVEAMQAGTLPPRGILKQLCQALHQLHREKALLPWLPPGRDEFGGAMMELENKVKDGLMKPAEAQRLRVYLRQINRILVPLADHAPEVMLHADVHVSNVRLGEDGTIMVVDFGDCRRGDPAADLAYFAFMADLSFKQSAVLLRAYAQTGPMDAGLPQRFGLRLAMSRIARYTMFHQWSGPQSAQCDDFRRHIQEDFIGLWRKGWLSDERTAPFAAS